MCLGGLLVPFREPIIRDFSREVATTILLT